ncbi:MAG: hypothetical protein JW722_06185 [Demequinaceae bacterium]|nr:hypothetical protein [Demequinaceae bacterium]
MKCFEVTIEVGPILPETVGRLKADGYAVFKGRESWRVQTTVPVLASGSIRAQAHYVALKVIDEYRLAPLTDPPAIALRDPDAGLDERPDLILHDTNRSYDPVPLPRAKRKWYQRAMELGLGERKGD